MTDTITRTDGATDTISRTDAATDASAAAATTRWELDPTHSSIHFAGRQLMISTVRGRFSRFEATVVGSDTDPETSSVEIRVDAASVDTGFEPRDQHLRSEDFLDAERHPWIVFRSTVIGRVEDDRLRVSGDLTIKDVTRPVVVDAKLQGIAPGMSGARRAAFSAQLDIDRRDWGMIWNMPVGGDAVLVGTQLQLQFELTFEEASSSDAASQAAA